MNCSINNSSTLVVNMALRPTVTGPIMTAVTVFVVLETVSLTLSDPPIDVPSPVFLFTLALGVSACVAHLFAWGNDHVLGEIHEVEERVRARLDSHELLDLDRAIAAAAGMRPRPSPRPRRRIQPREGSNVFDLN